ncbi:nuclear transport factor 2 family protein [Bosea sp. (in: a-proteobacteria)]|uniref:nuclear transport factor 2 family protein n=1 Tax=Bosea sp. (in: a-proteobacteria) TaxID=1871050 RepID=UPI0025BF06BB|nr:nuclear transport factor 2 family protein [Bosea sp. (in: a-proteobacteria)]
MADESASKALIRDAYAARHRGDLDALMGFFHPQCCYRLVGGPAAAEAFRQPDGLEAVREQMAGLIAAYVFSNVEELGLTVDGDRAILHWRADVACKPSGRSGPFEIVDIFTIADGKIASVTQFTDTAGVARLSAA